MDKPKVLMIGPGRNVMGGISAVVNIYYELGLPQRVSLKYIPSMEDGSKAKKLAVACKAYMEFCWSLRRVDIVHIHMAAQASFSRKACFVKRAYKNGKKIIIHQHAADFDEFFLKESHKAKRDRIKHIFAMADKVIVLSEEWAEFFGKYVCDSKKICVIYNGVMVPAYRKEVYSDHNVLFLGRLGNRKGSYDLLKAIPTVVDMIPDAMFYFGGDGEIERSRKNAEDMGILEHVRFLGWIKEEEKERYLKECSVFVLPSYHEGMPMSLLEAMACGLAAVSTNAGGIPQMIENGVNGIRIEAGDIEALKKSLIELLENEEKRKEMGQAAMTHVSVRFDAEKSIDRIYEVYAEVLCGDKQGGEYGLFGSDY